MTSSFVRGLSNVAFNSVRSTNRSLLQQLPVYRRDPSLIGNDIFIEPQGDFTTTETGDLETITGVESIVHSLLRRVTTPPDGYSRWIRTGNGLQTVDTNYGNEAYSYLSTPLSGTTPDAVKQAVLIAAEQEPRIRIINVRVETNYKDQIYINLDYRILGNNQLQSLNTTLLSKLVN